MSNIAKYVEVTSMYSRFVLFRAGVKEFPAPCLFC